MEYINRYAFRIKKTDIYIYNICIYLYIERERERKKEA
jgi:hypothetical protein